MIKIETIEIMGIRGALKGMRNPKNSWERSDSFGNDIGAADMKLCKALYSAGTEHRKYMRMIHVQLDITAPLYWWKEFDTYKIGTVANSCSTMHKIHSRKLELDDFSHEHLGEDSLNTLEGVITVINRFRDMYTAGGNKYDWWQMIQLLPSSYNQLRTIDLNYEVLMNIYRQRKNHKLDEWHTFCDWILTLPYMTKFLKEE